MDKYGFIIGLFPFKNLKPQTVINIIGEINPEIQKFSRGQIIYSENNVAKKIGFVIDGECSVFEGHNLKNELCLNTLKAGDSFGILSILCPGSEFPTVIKATQKASVLFISDEEFTYVIKRYPTVAMNVIKFLAQRISFLNKKISNFSGRTVEQRISSYLLQQNRISNCIDFCGTKIASSLNIGRASLYRTIYSFTEQGLIKVENKKIYILVPEGLERILK